MIAAALLATTFRVAVFAEPGFPAVDAPATDPQALRRALAGHDVTLVGLADVEARLASEPPDVLVLPYGSAFPKDAWPAILRYLEGGGNWVNLGGAPFAVPVVREGGGWRAESRRTAYHKALGITQLSAVDAAGLTPAPAPDAPDTARALAEGYRAGRVFEPTIRLASRPRVPSEDGSDGPREGRVVPLVHAVGAGGLALAAPFLEIDRLEGRFAGGRWVLATGDSVPSDDALRTLVERAGAGAMELTARPTHAGFHPGERPALAVAFRRPGRRARAAVPGPLRVELRDGRGSLLAHATAALEGSARIPVPLPEEGELARGLYEVRVELPTEAGETVRARTGFWIYDRAMLEGGRALTMGRDYFLRDGTPFPVTGTTYMASDVHRRFLLEPNPWLWERDFAAMAAAGVNLVRTGIWTGWKEHATADAEPREEVLRAAEVFLLTARAHDIPVIFTLFAFVPESWGGTNPYLDPRSVAAQARFAGAFARRLSGARDLAWDLINEPSFSSPARLWQCRPNYDASEESAWTAWLRATVPARDDAERSRILSDRWGSAPGESEKLPTLDDFGDRNLFGNARPAKAADYRRFAQEEFKGWASRIAAAIRESGGARGPITVGQDEGGVVERPNPLFFGDAVDFTTNHSWWNNDALLWDASMTRLPGRPNLIEETGLMVYERPDGTAWRDELEARDLLERKLALALGGGAAGFVQWLWNANVYMPSDNEAGIGFLRADGTARPELAPFTGLARFAARHRDLFSGPIAEDVVLVVPHSEMFSARGFAVAATQRALRTMEYALGTPVRVVAEHALGRDLGAPRLILLPSPRVLRQDSWEALLAAVSHGSRLLVTGPFDRDEYERPVERSRALGVGAATRPVAPEEELTIDGRPVRASFRGGKLEKVEKVVFGEGDPGAVNVVPRGKGAVLWSPLPVELSDDADATAALYAFARERAGIESSYGAAGAPDPSLLVRPVVFEKAVLYALVNEGGRARTAEVRTGSAAAPVSVTVPAGRASLLFVDRSSGAVIGRYPEEKTP